MNRTEEMMFDLFMRMVPHIDAGIDFYTAAALAAEELEHDLLMTAADCELGVTLH